MTLADADIRQQYGVSIIVSERTRDEAPEFAYRELDLVRVKGKDAPLKIYELLGRRDQVDQALRDELKLYREALKLYRARNWDMAEIQFVNLLRRAPDRVLYKECAKRVQRFRKQPPPAEWDGVYTHLTK